MKTIKWNIVRGFGSVKYFNISYVVLLIIPILAELYDKAATASDFFNKAVAFPITLRWLYAASLSYAIAIALYQYFCPPVVKRFANSDEYLSNSHEMFLRAHPHHRLNIVLTQLDNEIDEQVSIKLKKRLDDRDNSFGEKRLEHQRQIDRIVESLHGDAVQRFLLNDYDKKNIQRPIALWASFVLYIVGTIILVVLLTQRSLNVFGLI